MRYLPGLLGALAAFIVAKLLAWSGLGLELLAFVATYLVITYAADRALLTYGRDTGRN